MIKKMIIAVFLLSTLILIRHSILVNAFVLPPVTSHLNISVPDCFGKVITDFSPDWVTASDLALQPDGKYVAVGYINSGSAARPLIVRYTATGTIDATFGTDGFVVTDLGHQSNFSAVEVQNDGKIVAAGKLWLDGLLVRYNEDGSLDTTFNGTGYVAVDFGNNGWLSDLAILPDGEIAAIGTIQEDWHVPADIAAVRYLPDGTLDASFGLVVTDLGGSETANGIAVQADGKIIAVGSYDGNFAVLRYEESGDLDLSFGDEGVVTIDFGGLIDRALDVAIQPDGRIIVVGSGMSKYAATRLNPDGSLDHSFGDNGKVVLDEEEWISRVVLQPDGKIIILGSSGYLQSERFRVARLEANGALDTTFGVNGVTVTTFVNTDRGSGLVLQPDGMIVAGGSSLHTYFVLAKYRSDGILNACETFLPLITR
jgi:uncharacterized delta-60 repeat protein